MVPHGDQVAVAAGRDDFRYRHGFEHRVQAVMIVRSRCSVKVTAGAIIFILLRARQRL